MNTRTIKFLSYYRPYRGRLIVDLICAVVVTVVTILLPLCARYITKDILEGGLPDALDQIGLLGLAMLILVLIYTGCSMFVAYQGHVMGALMERDMRQELFDHYQKLSFGFYDDEKTGQLMTRITNDTFALGELYHHGPEDVVISLLSFLGAFVVLATVNLRLAVIIMLFLPAMAAYARHFNRKMKQTLRISRDRVGDINASVEDTLSGVRVVRAFGNEALEKAKFAHENERLIQSRRNDIRSETFFYEGLVGFTQLMSITVILLGAVAIVNHSLDLADLITFLLYIGILIEPIRRFGNFTRLWQEGITGFERFMEMREIEPDSQDAADAIGLGQVRGAITFRAVSFKYTEQQNYVIKNLSLAVRAGEYIALVGTSGVGKTTLCSLIPRFYQVSEGQILLDGIDIRNIRLHSLRSNIGVVQQDVYLFVGTVAQNIGYGKHGASRQKIIDAAIKANAHDFIMALPDGYDTEIGQRGVRLSGGQRQRLSIARVFLKDPPILILDEPTSALDTESERAIQKALERLTDQRTTLVIAHRLSTIRNAHRILLLTDNGIEEQGTHDELIALNGAYANLYSVQISV